MLRLNRCQEQSKKEVNRMASYYRKEFVQNYILQNGSNLLNVAFSNGFFFLGSYEFCTILDSADDRDIIDYWKCYYLSNFIANSEDE